jgi:hypothetical protein
VLTVASNTKRSKLIVYNLLSFVSGRTGLRGILALNKLL